MRIDRYSVVEFKDRTPDDLSGPILRWVLGGTARARAGRQRLGVHPDWTADMLQENEDLQGDGCEVRVRWSTDRREHLVRFVHRDSAPEVSWWTVFKLTAGERTTLVECAVARDAPRGSYLNPTAAPPRVLIELINEHESAVVPRELTLPALRMVSPQDVVDFLDLVLLEPTRIVPVVLVARDVYGTGSAVDLSAIDGKMRGLAVVASLDGRVPVAKFDSELAARGLSPELRCYNGAVHTYGATFEMSSRHRLWLRPSIESLDSDLQSRSMYVGETLARHLSLDKSPPSFVRGIEEFDRRQRQAYATRLPSLAGDLETAQKLLDEESLRATQAERRLRDVEDAALELEIRLQQAELEAATERMHREGLLSQLAEVSSKRRGGTENGALRDMLCHLAGAKVVAVPTPLEVLEVLADVFADRLVVLPEAMESARKDGVRFRKPLEVFSLLIRLTTKYYDALQGGGDAQARQVFTKSEFAAKGSETEMKSDACEKDRVRVYGGKRLVMWPHLRAGGKGAAEDCLRIHFVWEAEEKKLIIGHCGSHLKEA